ncbi:unnamed protein product [Strongylus vulgaris]|uniref:Single domain-containing protein n=1 Tax=Strongylus vulgaris TaxID=40348 RepID=A0A3P7L397_STRVU|nr:unnamed protein product [Strongylus vulgaris]
MKTQLFLLVAFVPALLAQLFGIANPGQGFSGGGGGCTGFLRFSARAGMRPYGEAIGQMPPCACPCPGANAPCPWPGVAAAGTRNVILNSCVPACCPGKK